VREGLLPCRKNVALNVKNAFPGATARFIDNVDGLDAELQAGIEALAAAEVPGHPSLDAVRLKLAHLFHCIME
jgi:hypothetical protein